MSGGGGSVSGINSPSFLGAMPPLTQPGVTGAMPIPTQPGVTGAMPIPTQPGVTGAMPIPTQPGVTGAVATPTLPGEISDGRFIFLVNPINPNSARVQARDSLPARAIEAVVEPLRRTVGEIGDDKADIEAEPRRLDAGDSAETARHPPRHE